MAKIASFVLSIIPFMSFLIGYLIITYRYSPAPFVMPNFVGAQSTAVLRSVSEHKLMPRIIKEVEDAQLPEGTVIQQKPAAGTFVRQNQSVFLAISCKPPTQKTPLCIGKTQEEAIALSTNAGVRVHVFFLPHHAPNNTCFAQYPAAHTPLGQEPLILYFAHVQEKLCLWPNFKGKPLNVVIDFLAQQAITPHLISSRNAPIASNAPILDQRPLAGSYIQAQALSSLYVQLYL
jgi:hypothetical protein